MPPETLELPAAEALGASLETMAFISPLPPAGPVTCPAEPRRVTIAFAGPASAVVELVAPATFGAVLWSNLVACDPGDPEAVARGDDALKELMNVTCGALIASTGNAAGYEMGIPAIEPFDPEQWDALTAPGEATVLDADGHLIAVRVRAK